jgi:uncharacterized protein (TIGR03032 family)
MTDIARVARPARAGGTLVMKPEPTPTATAAAAQPLRSSHTRNFGPLLEELGAALLVSTYQAGKLVVLRSDDGVLNTHFRGFNVPMGLACDGERLAIGTRLEIWEYHNVPAVARKLEPLGKHDACFLPRIAHVTGNVQVHEMAWGSEASRERERPEPELWFVNTRFSCLATRAINHSFVPRWRPPFISALAPEDRCHLNGLGVRDGLVRYVTALGTTDSPAGWRADKRKGGVLLDVPSGEVIAGGLSMPHSPRWHDGRLWVLDSGNGRLAVVDEATGRLDTVAEMPGFTRGLDFHGRFAFIGLSQVRESAVFSGIAIAERPQRACGVWVVDTVSGQTVAFVQFEDAVQEIFAVQVLSGRRFPDVVNDNTALMADSFVLPQAALAEVSAPLRELPVCALPAAALAG